MAQCEIFIIFFFASAAADLLDCIHLSGEIENFSRFFQIKPIMTQRIQGYILAIVIVT